MREVMTGEATPSQIAALRRGAAGEGRVARGGGRHGRRRCSRRDAGAPRPPACVDIVGTGGDGAHTVNISTMAAVVTAAAGVPVAKHGNRAASSSSGAADVLEALGVVIDLPAAAVARCVRGGRDRLLLRAGVPPRHAARRPHPPRDGHRHRLQLPRPADQPGPPGGGRRSAAPTAAWRRCSPASSPPGAAGRWCSAGDDGLDELTTATTSSVWVVRDGEVEPDRVDPAALGIPTPAPDALRGGDPAVNADVFRRVLDGERGAGARRGAAQRGGGAGRLRRAGAAAARRAGGRDGAGRGGRRRRPGRRAAGPLGRGQPGVAQRR